MRVLWISCLLIGSISCFPPQGGSGVPSPMWLPRSHPGQAPSKPDYEETSEQAGALASYSSYPWSYGSYTAGGPSDSGSSHSMEYPAMSSGQKPSHQKPAGQSSTYGSYSGPYSAEGGPSFSGSQQYGAQSSQSGGAEQESWSSSSDGGDDEDEPVFTPVSEEDQVYAFKSRSRYNQKRLLFSQFRYTPTEARQHQGPVFPHPGKTSQHSKGPVKGGYLRSL